MVIVEGDTYWVIGNPEDGDYAVEEFVRASSAMSRPWASFIALSIAADRTAVVLMAYVGINSAVADQGKTDRPTGPPRFPRCQWRLST